MKAQWLHCEALYDSLHHQTGTLYGNYAVFSRSEHMCVMVVTDGTPQSASILADKINHLLPFRSASLAVWESLMIQLMNWGDEWNSMIAIIVHQFGSQKAFVAQCGSHHICLHRNFSLVPIAYKKIEQHDAVVCFSAIDVQADDCFSIFSSSLDCEEVGYHLTLGWQREFGINSEMMLKERQPCIRTLLSDVISRLRPRHNSMESCFFGIVRFRKPKYGVLMLGPPEDPSLDDVFVHKLIENKDAIKMVCGGTTSEIVARALDRRLITIPTSSTNIPPLSVIDGIDIVSEGVLTLRKTIELLEILDTVPSLVLTFHDMYQYDGAFHLARLLCSQCTHIHFLIGMAHNKNHDYLHDICFETKKELGQKLIALLVSMGKYVTVEYG